MKKILFAALIVLMLTAVCVVGLLPALSNSTEGVVTADEANASGAAISANQIKTAISEKALETPEEGVTATEVGTPEAWSAMTADGVYSLTTDITVTGTIASFSGEIYGNGHTVTVSAPLFAALADARICDLTIAGTVTGNGALANTAEGSTIINVANNATVKGDGAVGGLVGTLTDSALEYCSNTGAVTGTTATGGLVGSATEIEAEYCINTGSITGGNGIAGGIAGTATQGLYLGYCANGDGTNGAVSAKYTIGGIVGKVESVAANAEGNPEIEHCLNYVAMTVTATDAESAVGGIAGCLNGANIEVVNCSNVGAVTGPGVANNAFSNGFGGMIGRAAGDTAVLSMDSCMNAATITVTYTVKDAHYNGVAGILGYDLCGDTTVQGCVNMGTLQATGDGAVNAGIGGMIGQVKNGAECANKKMTIKNCNNGGTVNGGRPGGIFGVGEFFTGVALIENCSNRGAITSPANYAGGIAARLESPVAPTDEVPYPIIFKDCTNVGLITAGADRSAGILAYAAKADSPIKFEGCENYGNINNGFSAGIAAQITGDVACIKCLNEGDITATGTSATASGIVSTAGGEKAIFEDCTNNGTITTDYNHAAGILAEGQTDTTFIRCINNGDVTNGVNDAAGIYAKAWTNKGTSSVDATFEDCVNTGNITANRYGGGIAGWMEETATFEGCSNSGKIVACSGKNDGHAGGLAGRVSGATTFTSCSNTGDVSGVQSGDRRTGGILGVGNNTVTMTSCTNAGFIDGTNGALTGGLCGRAENVCAFTDCVNNGNVLGGNNQTGGIVAEITGKGTFTRCTNNGNVTAKVNDAGGILGRGFSNSHATEVSCGFDQCVNTGDIISEKRHAGGISGWLDDAATYTKCVNTGTVKGAAAVGGIMGQSTGKATVTSCVNTGYVEGGQQVGGIAGVFVHTSADGSSVLNCVVTGNVHHTGANEGDKSYCVAGIVGYCYNKPVFKYNVITGNITGNFTKVETDLVNRRTAAAIAGYQNANEGLYMFNYFTGTLDAGEQGVEILLKKCPDHTICDGSNVNSTYVKWNYTVNPYPFYMEKEGGTVKLYDPANRTGHNDGTCYYGTGVISAEDVANGNLLQIMQSASDANFAGLDDGTFVQVTVCNKISMPIHKDTAALYEQWCDAEHTYDQLVKDETGHWYECACGEVAPEGVSAHTYVEVNDAESHWEFCTDCYYVTEKIAHNLVNDRDATYHWQYCDDCGKIVNKAEHAFTKMEQASEYTHIFVCSDPNCGLVNEARGEIPHQYKYDVTDEGHRMQCACGALQNGEAYTAHTPVNDTVYHDSTLGYHWQLCACGYKLTEDHYTEDLDAAPDCTHKLTCDVCGEAFGDLAPENHVQEIVWDKNETKHYGRYPCCGVEVGKPDAWVPHNWASKTVGEQENEQEIVYCVDCGLECAHTGGDATCSVLAKCDYCNYFYGELDENDHRTVKTLATCIKKAVCADCNEEYGEKNLENHDATCVEEYILTVGQEATHHTKRHSACLQEIETGEHIVETPADCDSKAVCSICHLEYGVPDKTNHDALCGVANVIWVTVDYENVRTHHKGTYKVCGEPYAEEQHTFEDGVCTVCSFICANGEGGHKVGTPATCCKQAVCEYCGESFGDKPACEYDTDVFLRDPDSVAGAEQHYNPCKTEGCPTKGNLTACAGGTANCLEKAVCADCKQEYGSTNPNYHKNGGDTGETKEVPAKGQETTHHYTIYTCCEVVVADTTVAHTFGDDNVCDICNYACEHGDYRYEKTYIDNDDSKHNKICTICAQIVATEEHRKDYENTNDSAATCQQPAFCGLCGSSYGTIDENAHNFSNLWTQIDDFVDPDAIGSMDSVVPTKPVHYHECLNEGCTVKSDLGDCNGQETQTCASPAKCHVCAGEYGTVSDKCTGVDPTKWDHETVENVQYHFHLCAHCGEKNHDYAACAVGEGGSEATCTSKATCGICGAEFGEVNESAHTTTEQTWKVDDENNQHYKVWNCCNREVADSRATHTYINTEKPSECECGYQCQHGEWTYTDKGDGNHTKSCDVCLYEVDEAHTFAGDWSFDDATSKHYHACTGEGCTARDSEGDCSADVVATCQTAAKCSVCGKIYGDPNPDVHTLSDYIQENDQHYKKCTIDGCTYTTTPVACDGTGANCQTKATCTLCGNPYGQPDPNVHANTTNYTYTPVDGGIQHRCYYVCCPAVEVAGSPMDHTFNGDTVCDDCGYTCTHETAKGWSGWTKDDNDTHSKTCQNCGYQDKVAHSFDTTLFNGDAAGHYYKCTQEGCDATTEVIPHVYDRYVFPDETKHQRVCACGHDDPNSETEEHDFDVYEHDENQHWLVCDCQKTTESTAHDFRLSGDKDGHQLKCACGVTSGPNESHTFSSETGLCTDAECGYACAHEKLTYVASETLNTVHDAFCDVCGKKVISNGVHTFDFQNPSYVSDGHYHWIACPCGAKLDAENGAMEHSTTAEGDAAATCKTRAYCSVCKQHYGEVDSYNHATPETYDYWTDPADLGRHIKAYDCCGMEITSEVHTFENGVCKFCDADCVHTGGRANCQNKAICTTCGQPYGNVSADHAYNNACDADCNVCGTTREIAHKFGEWVETTAPTTTAKGKETRTCSVCGVTETYETDMLPVEEEKLSTGMIVAIVAGSVIGGGAIIGVIVWIAKSRAAASYAASQQKPWRTKENKKKKWKKRK